MRQGHFFVVFVLIALGCFISLYVVQKKYDSVIEEKQWLESVLLEAIEDTGNKSKIALKEEDEKKKQMVAAAFSDAFSGFFGRMDTLEEKDFWRLYIPMLVFVEEDGAFFYHLQTGDTKQLGHIWTDKLYFEFPDGCDASKKKALMADALEQKASEIITNHNIIASQYGVNYQFYLPVFFQDTSRTPEFPMLFVVFQGWPLNVSGTSFYGACIDAGIFLRPRKDSGSDYPKILN